nr:ADP-ribosylation factor-like protein 9 isoform X2 [Aotus nancymaae]
MEFLEIGGSEPFRSYSEMYLSKGLLLIFVVDSADHRRLPEAKKYLHQLISANPVLPLVVFANKQGLGERQQARILAPDTGNRIRNSSPISTDAPLAFLRPEAPRRSWRAVRPLGNHNA